MVPELSLTLVHLDRTTADRAIEQGKYPLLRDRGAR